MREFGPQDDDRGTMLRRSLFRLLPLAAAVAAFFPGSALAGGGDYVLDGGTARQQAQVRSALEASSFDWGIVRQQVTVHVGAYGTSHSTPGHVWLEGRLLDAGVFSWGP
ncbi:MAG: hypothetical protein H0T13_02870 [Actinobacteria bacterium]|nr:hypothetical protein [Actinomycetota bacterium]